MANTYASLDDFFSLFDRREFLDLSGDDGSHVGSQPNAQFCLDAAASEFDSHVQGRYGAVPIFASTTVTPAVVKRYVCVKAAQMLFGRRPSAPESLKGHVEWADKWMEDVDGRKLTIPTASPAVVPALVDSDFTDGKSRWDYLFGSTPSPTGPSRGT